MRELSGTATQILDHALTLIVAGGYSGFSYADIASQVGIRKPSIHHHFPTKAELVQVLVERYRQQARDGLAALEQAVADPPAQLRSYVTYWQHCITETEAPICICALLASELPLLPDSVATEVKAHFRDLAAWLSAVFERGQQQGRLRLSRAPKIEAEAFMATVHGAMLSARAYADPEIFGRIMQHTINQIDIAA